MADVTVSQSPSPPPSTHSIQKAIDTFWDAHLAPAKASTKPPTVLPSHLFAHLVGKSMPQGDVKGQSISVSYKKAVQDCIDKVATIVAECRRNNQKYSDPHFDLDDMNYCLNSLSATTESQEPTPSNSVPACAKRVGDIFDNPKFYVERNAHVKDLRQGAEGDCWFIASLGCLCVDAQFPKLVEKLCPSQARDEKVGVYGFVFFRDGEWMSEIIDDKLYISTPDYDDCDDERRTVWDRSHSRLDPEVSREEYRKTFQSNSDALFFGSCANPNETWVPLIEKAFAKAHGDYNAIDGGWPGEGVEDLTGGVTTQIVSADILDKDQLWNEGFLRVNKTFLLNASTREYGHADPNELGRQGIEDSHAYSLLRAVEYGGNRLCLVKNPWGETEWNGPWSDGSKEWTPEALKALDHKFGNEGIFWMPYADFLRRYDLIWRTRVFTDDWTMTQHWTTVQVPWAGDYNDTKFEFDLPKTATAVIVLSQLDTRYFAGLTGQYSFQIAFRLHKSGEKTHIIRGYSSGDRSATTEVELEAGTYEVHLQISGQLDATAPKVDDVVKQNWLTRREKLMAIGLSYDLANAKGQSSSGPKQEADPTTSQPVAPTVTVHSNVDTPSITVHSNVDATAAGGTTVDTTVTVAKDDDDDDDNSSDAPWDAVCVVGLKVFTPGLPAVIRVVKPTEGVKANLDVDDPEKDAVEKAAAQNS